MTVQALTVAPEAGLAANVLESVLLGGNLAQLRPVERVQYMQRVCESLGLNPLTKPFEFIVLNGKLVMYARKDATEQLRKLHGVSIRIVARELVEDVYIVTAQATDKHGRVDESVGAVPIGGLRGEAKANALMKAETKAKRRVTLSISGLGVLDETEVDSIPGARPFAEAPEYTPPAKTEEEAAALIDQGPKAESRTVDGAPTATGPSSTAPASTIPATDPKEPPKTSGRRSSRGSKGSTQGSTAEPSQPSNGGTSTASGTASAPPAAAGSMEKALRIQNLLVGAKPEGLGFPKPRAMDWCKARFGKAIPQALSSAQQDTAIALLEARLGSEAEYEAALAVAAAEGLCQGRDGKAA